MFAGVTTFLSPSIYAGTKPAPPAISSENGCGNSSQQRGWKTLTPELGRATSIALPMIVVTISQYMLRAAPLLMLGNLSSLSLSSASVAFSLCNVTGFILMSGMASALETMCGQAYGAEQYQKLGTYTCSAIFSLFLVCIPISLLWIYSENLLVLIGQDPLIAAGAGKFSMLLIASLFPCAIVECLVRFLQAQPLVLPLFWSSILALCLHLPLCWALVFKFNLGIAGAALSIGMSYWFTVALLFLYIMLSPSPVETNFSLSGNSFAAVWDFLWIAVPSSLMLCLEGWTFEIIILLSGLLPNPQLETSVLAVCYMIVGLHFYIPYAIGVAVSTLVSNELGAGKAWAAKVAVHAVLVMAAVEVLVSTFIVIISRPILGHLISNDIAVVTYIEQMVPYLCLSIIMDSLQAVLSGVVRGSGWQRVGAYVNLGAYYFVGLPVALVLGFVLHLRGKGLWAGLVAGGFVQALSLAVLMARTDWEKQACKARQGVFGEDVIVQSASEIM